MAPIVIYHGNCADGFSAAWVVREYYKRELPESSEEFPVFYPGTYGKPVPVGVTARDVILVDFSYPRDIMEKICKFAKTVLVIDHHKTAEANLKGLDTEFSGTELLFDMEHSGAMLAWHYFFNDKLPPAGLLHVEDRDLWRFNIWGTREYNANMFSYPYTWENWDRLMNEPIDQVIRDGAAIDRKHFKDIKELLEVVTRRMRLPVIRPESDPTHMLFDDIEIPVANLPYTMGSDAANILAKKEQDEGRPPVAAYYYDTPDGRCFGFRSIGDFDCSLLAKALGGGGHRNASGANKIQAATYQGFEVGIHPNNDLSVAPLFPHADI